jgi:hypothetical protein
MPIRLPASVSRSVTCISSYAYTGQVMNYWGLGLRVFAGFVRPRSNLSGLWSTAWPSMLLATDARPQMRRPRRCAVGAERPSLRQRACTQAGASSTFCAPDRFEELFALAQLRSNPATRRLNDRRIGLIASESSKKQVMLA